MTYNEERQPLLNSVTSRQASCIGNVPKKETRDPVIVTTYRYRVIFALLCTLSFTLNTMSRGIIAVTIVAMINGTNKLDSSNETDECPAEKSLRSDSVHSGKFNWDSQTQGIILSSFAYGYTLTQIPSGLLSGKFGGKRLVTTGILFTGFLSLFVPLGVKLGYGVLIVIQVLTGCSLGLVTPAVTSMLGRVAPVMERSFLTSLAYMGSPAGTVISQTVSGVISNSSELGGWPTVYYGYGIIAICWCLPWCLFAKDTATKTSRNNTQSAKSSKSFLSPKLLTSRAVWAIYLAHFAYGWVFSTMTTFLPTYLSRVLKFDLSQNGIISSIPFISSWISQTFSGYIVDYLRNRGFIKTLTARRICVFLTFIASGLPLVTIYYAGCSKIGVVAILSISMFFCGFCISGFLVNVIDIASNFSGQIMGISNTLSTSVGIMAPTLIGFITETDPTRFGWHIVFCVIAGMNVFGTVCFFALGKGEELSWNRRNDITLIVKNNEVYIRK